VRLLATLKENVPPDCYRIIKMLLSNTTLEPRVDGVMGEKFSTTIGTPQGDGLSPILFTIYLEAAMRELRKDCQVTSLDPKKTFYMETLYADDTDFISDDSKVIDVIKANVKATFQKFNLKVNEGKTEYLTINRESCGTADIKKLGSRVNCIADMNYRFEKAREAFRLMRKIWVGEKYVSLGTRIKMYKAYVIPILTYNLGTTVLIKTKMDRYDGFHRKQLRQVLRVFYPNHIGNEAVYAATSSGPISTLCHTMRMKLFGHILRGSKESPAYKVMEFCLTNPRSYEKRPGKPLTNICQILKDDMELIGAQLVVRKDLENLAKIERKVWQRIVKAVVIGNILGVKGGTATEKEMKILQEVKDLVKKTNKFRNQQSGNEGKEEEKKEEEEEEDG
jgi:hypothetical protein